MTEEEFKDIEERAKRSGLPFEVIRQMDYFQNYTASNGFGHGRNNVFRVALQNEIVSAITKASDNYGFERAELKGKISTLEAENARLREALETSRARMIEVSETLFRKGIADMRLKIVVECIDAALEGKP